MISRCENERGDDYADYGGRGITVCSRWRNDFAAFLADVGPRPSSKHSIDRYPNTNGNYEPGNVRWATSQQQNANRRGCVYITVGEQTLTVAEWERERGFKPTIIHARIRSGWDPVRAVTTPARPNVRKAS